MRQLLVSMTVVVTGMLFRLPVATAGPPEGAKTDAPAAPTSNGDPSVKKVVEKEEKEDYTSTSNDSKIQLIFPFFGFKDEVKGEFNWWAGVEANVYPFAWEKKAEDGERIWQIRLGLHFNYSHSRTLGYFWAGQQKIRWSQDHERAGPGINFQINTSENFLEVRPYDYFQVDSVAERSDGVRGFSGRGHIPGIYVTWWNSSINRWFSNLVYNSKGPTEEATDEDIERSRFFRAVGVEFIGQYQTNKDVFYVRGRVKLVLWESSGSNRTALEALIGRETDRDWQISYLQVRIGAEVEGIWGRNVSEVRKQTAGLLELFSPATGLSLLGGFGGGDMGQDKQGHPEKGLAWRVELSWSINF